MMIPCGLLPPGRANRHILQGGWSMKRRFKCIAGLLMVSVMGLYFPRVTFCTELGPIASADKKTITRHEPKIMSEPEKEILVAEAKTVKRKKTPWLLMGLGAAALVGLVAIAGGGGGGNPDHSPEEEGDVTVSW